MSWTWQVHTLSPAALVFLCKCFVFHHISYGTAVPEEVKADWENFLRQSVETGTAVEEKAFVMPKSNVYMEFEIGQKLELEVSIKVSSTNVSVLLEVRQYW